MAAILRSYVWAKSSISGDNIVKPRLSFCIPFDWKLQEGKKLTKANNYFKVHCDKSEILLLFFPFYLSWVVFASIYAVVKYVVRVHQYTLGKPAHPLEPW